MNSALKEFSALTLDSFSMAGLHYGSVIATMCSHYGAFLGRVHTMVMFLLSSVEVTLWCFLCPVHTMVLPYALFTLQ